MKPSRPAPPEDARRYVEEGHWRNRCADEYLTWCVREFGDRVAVVDRDRQVTFAEIDDQATRLAVALADRGVVSGDVVAFQLPNWLEAVVTYQAIAKLGAVANPIVPIYRGRELRFILRQGRAKMVVIPSEFRGFDFAGMYAELRGDLPDLADVIVVGETSHDGMVDYEDLISRSRDDGEAVRLLQERPRDPDEVLLLLYTSGTTAEPKGALHSHNTLLFDAHYIGEWFSMNERDVIFNPSPVTHITGVLCALNIPFVLGCKVVLQDTWDADAALELMSRERASFMIFATPFLQGITYSPRLSDHDLSSIRYIVCGGADIPLDLMRDATDRVGTVVRQYGATEAPSTTCTTLWDPVERRTESDGRWMLPTEGRIVDDVGSEVLPGQVGEVIWRGPDMFLGYLNPELNDSAFTDDGYFRTGDLATIDEEGYLRVQGRKKDIINRGGEKISVREIEDLIFAHPAVQEVAVVAMPDPQLGEKGCAYIVLESGQNLSAADLLGYLEGHEIAKQKLPERLEFVAELPRTASGKVQKYVLRDRVRTQLDAGEDGQP